jgi:nucleotide-binding universal stress UspA family protein
VILNALRIGGGDLLVTGLRPHDVAFRLFHDETVVDVLRRSNVPVLAAAPTLGGRPRRIVAAVDFSRASLEALSTALVLAAPGATVVLAHIEPPAADGGRDGGAFERIYRAGVESAFRPLEAALRGAGCAAQSVIGRGDAASGLLAIAADHDAELITTGLHRYPHASRPMPGSVTAALVRAGRRSLLVAPPL